MIEHDLRFYVASCHFVETDTLDKFGTLDTYHSLPIQRITEYDSYFYAQFVPMRTGASRGDGSHCLVWMLIGGCPDAQLREADSSG